MRRIAILYVIVGLFGHIYVVADASASDGARPCARDDINSIAGLRAWPAEQQHPVEIESAQWFQGLLGWIVVQGPCAAVVAEEEMQAAQRAFETYFGAAPVRGAVVDAAFADRIGAIRDAGAVWALPWKFGGDEAHVQGSADVREQIAGQLESQGIEPGSERFDAMLEKAMGPLAEKRTSRPDAGLQANALRHEIAHMLFIHGIWPSQGESRVYGGGAPDWLDEAAAIAAESDSMTKGRREAFRRHVSEGKAIPLSEYFTMAHPAFGNPELERIIAAAREKAGQGEPVVIQADASKMDPDRLQAFYAQTRGLIDYLVERSGNQRILLLITRALMDGQTFAQWLAEAGPANGLPTEIDELDRRFRAWAVADG